MVTNSNKANNHILNRWTIEDAVDTYGVGNWGADYFDISPEGEVVVFPMGKGAGPSISLMEVVSGIKARGMDLPVLLRFENILDAQIALLHKSFNSAIAACKYQGEYRGVYPVKVNQQQQIIEEIASFGSQFNHGLEAGSKAELIAAISLLSNLESCLVCNGYKDEEFIDLALYAQKMGYKIFLVIERYGELPLIIKRAKAMNIRPNIGVRLKLSVSGGGLWMESGGDRSVFGLNLSQVLQTVETLRGEGMLDCLKLLHYHLGSQIPNIRDIRAAVTEACRIYNGLVGEGAAMGYLDLGGGLAVDYDGSHTNFPSSRNYTLEEYCADIIETIMTCLQGTDVTHPTIITESGRATVAYSSILLFNVLDVSSFEHGLRIPEALPPDSHELLVSMFEILKDISPKNLQEHYHDAIYYRDELRQLFLHGHLRLWERGMSEGLFRKIMCEIAAKVKQLKYIPDEFEKIESALSDIYYCNFSVFQSLPDVWAIDQLFPVMPIHRLKEQPTRQSILADITCDCDGKIDKFTDLHDIKDTLLLHEFDPDQEYILGVFLVGAYQETLGDLHNLLGDTNVVGIRIDPDGHYKFVREIDGDSVGDVLSYVEYDTKSIIDRIRKQAERAVQEGRVQVDERRGITKAFEAGLRGYTYFEK